MEDITKILDVYFSQTDKRFLDTTRIPRICDDIRDIKNELKDGFKSAKEAIDKKDDDYERRLRELEAFKNTLTGKMAIMAFAVGVVVGLAMWALNKFL